MPAPVFGGEEGVRREVCVDGRRVPHHNYYPLRLAGFDVLCHCVEGPRGQCLRRSVIADDGGFLVTHLETPVFSFTFPFSFAPFLSVAPRPFLRQLLAVRFVFAAYGGRGEGARGEMLECRSRDIYVKGVRCWYSVLRDFEVGCA